MFETLSTPYIHEIEAFGANWCGPEQYRTHEDQLVARYESGQDSDGQTVEVYCYPAPARFYRIKVLEGTNSVGEFKPAYFINTGSGMAALAADIAEAISEGVIGFSTEAE